MVKTRRRPTGFASPPSSPAHAMPRRPHSIALLLLLALAPAASAHSFGRLYNLPVPLWLYAWGAAAALLLSFLAAAYFLTVPVKAGTAWQRDVSDHRIARALVSRPMLALLRLASLTALGLCIATGFWGSANPYANFNMTLFWIVFLLGFGWLTALLGNGYALINPWRLLADALGRLWPRYERGLFRYPQRLGVWPALLLYGLFIGVELFGHGTPLRLAWLLLGYTALNLIGAGLIGRRDWFANVEFFSIWFRLVALMAPVELRESPDGAVRIVLRAPFAGLLQARAASWDELLFVLFMLSSTAFDGLHETVPWKRLFWGDFYQLLKPWVGDNVLIAVPVLQPWFLLWQKCALLLSPLLYLGVYLLFVQLSRWASGSRLSMKELALRFAYPLLPIALVYHLSHYWTLILSQGVKIIALISDPFGSGANWFGTAHWFQTTIIPDMGWVWHTQVALIVAGHVASVVVAHLEALQTFGSPRRATLSQLPMLLLMMLFTAAGLWILAQPIQTGA